MSPVVMQNAPGVDDIERPERPEVGLVKCAALLHAPVGIVGVETTAQLGSTGDGVGVVVERMDPRTEISGSEREQAGPGADVEERPAPEVAQPVGERRLGKADALRRETSEEARPVGPEGEAVRHQENIPA